MTAPTYIIQSGSSVSGQACERYEFDCYPIQNGAVAGSTLNFDYSWVEGGTTHTVHATLTLSPDGSTLSGKYDSSKCSCEVPITVLRI